MTHQTIEARGERRARRANQFFIGVGGYIPAQVPVVQTARIVEQGASGAVLQRPQHAYSRSLLAVVPRLAVLT